MTFELENITKRAGADDHIYETSLSLAPGGFNILLGATGAGKTTLIKIMAGLEKPTTGRIIFDGRDITGLSTQKRNVSLVHQFFINYPNLNVFENIASPLRVARLSKGEIERKVGEVAELLKLTPMLGRRPNELSGGQQQRTALARALVKDSDLILLDEPLANLDYKLREELRDELPRIFADRGTIVVYATSEPTEALLLGGKTAAMREGRIAAFGKTLDLYRTPSTLDTALVFSDPPINTAPVEKKGQTIYFSADVRWPAFGAIQDAADGTYTMAIRPHYVTPQSGDQDSVWLKGKVQVTELSGSESVAHFELGSNKSWVSQSHGVHPYQVGEAHDFFVDVKNCLYFDPSGQLVAR